jgi:hypothetical protein
MSDFDRSLSVSPTRERSLMQFGLAALYVGAILVLMAIAPHGTLTQEQLTQDTTMVIAQPIRD